MTEEKTERFEVAGEKKTDEDFTKLLLNLDEFEAELSEKTKVKRDEETQLLDALRANVTEVEALMKAETVKREEGDEVLKRSFMEVVENMKTEVLSELHERSTDLSATFETVDERLTDLKDELQLFMKRIPEEITEKTSDLSEKLSQFQESFEKEKAAGMDRENTVEEKIMTLEELVLSGLEDEMNEREKQCAEIKNHIERSCKDRRQRVKDFQDRFEQQVESIREVIQKEQQTRERSDDEIVSLLTTYVKKIQKSLRAASSVQDSRT